MYLRSHPRTPQFEKTPISMVAGKRGMGKGDSRNGLEMTGGKVQRSSRIVCVWGGPLCKNWGGKKGEGKSGNLGSSRGGV